jgi:hypothetical protein
VIFGFFFGVCSQDVLQIPNVFLKMFPIASHFLSHSILAMLQVPKVGEFPMFQKYWWWANQMAPFGGPKKKKKLFRYHEFKL